MTLLKKSLRIDNGWLIEVEHCRSPNFNSRPDNMTPRLLVVHNISLPPAKFGGGYIKDLFLNRLDSKVDPYFETIESLKVSAHLLIERDGALIQFVSFDQRAWHAGASEYCNVADCNDFSIGIEMEGTDTLSYTEQQYQQLALVSAALIRYYPQLNSEHVTGHSDIAPQRKTDPGMAFNWTYYHRLLDREITG